MFAYWVVSLTMVCTCLTTFITPKDGAIELFATFHSKYGAHLGLEEAAIFDAYAKQLVLEYQQFEKNGGFNKEFAPENIPYYWAHVVLSGELSPRLIQQAIAFLREGKSTTDEEKIAAFVLLDRVNLKGTVLDIWSDENPQVQFNLLERLFKKENRYADFAPTIAKAVNHDAQVGWQVSPDSGYSLPLGFVVDCYLLDLIRADPDQHAVLETLISTDYLRTVAKASCNTIGERTLLAIHQDFLAGKHDEHLGCSFRFDFALTEDFARDLLRLEFSECRIDRYRGLRTISRRYPDLANQVLSELATSDKLEDLAVVLKFFDGPIFRSLKDRPVVVTALRKHLHSTNPNFLTSRGFWLITSAAFSENDVGAYVPVEVKEHLAANTIAKLDSICEDINRSCPRTFFAKSLEEAILSIGSSGR